MACLTEYLPIANDEQTPTYTMIQQPGAEPITPKVDAIIVKGVAVVNMFYPFPLMTFAIKPYVSSLRKVNDRVDIELEHILG